ncbi:MAG: phenylalanine--tRNA ligase subunit beta [Dongiaceae bacterium]
MKFTLSWLKNHIDTDADIDAIGARLTMLGLEVEDIADRAKDLAPFTVAYVKEAKPHPNADKLRVCIVETSSGTHQVVCGAPNARTGMKGVFAPVGSHIPGTNLDLNKGVIRGVDSNGMLVSMREMGLSDEHDGIIELADDAPVGEPFARLLGLDDPVIDINVTADRPDCLGVHGVARDLAAAGIGKLRALDLSAVAGTFDSPVKWLRDLPADRQHLCPYVVGRYFRGVKNGPSPKWLQDKLLAIGLRPISALVDITNYVTFDLGRPLHVFDAKRLSGDLTMRLAKPGESIQALDGKTYQLDDSMVVIADKTGPHGIGGIMGGAASGCDLDTTDLFLEVALFDPIRTAASGRKLGIQSDARFRFERGVDPESANWGAEVAARLILDLCGGEASRPVGAGAMPKWQRQVALRPDRVRTLGGVDLPAAESLRMLAALGFTPTEKNGLIQADIPSWRADVEDEADLVEEVTRIYGFDRIPSVPLKIESALPEPAITPAQRRVQISKRLLVSRGLMEAVTFSFMENRIAERFTSGNKPPVKLANPIAADLDAMRPSILPNLLQAAARNAARGLNDPALFEVGPQYSDDTPEGQATVAAGLRNGHAVPRHWAVKPRPADAFDAKGDALALLGALGAPVENLQVSADAPGWYHPGRSGSLRLGPSVIAWFGEIHPRILKELGVKGAASGFEVFLDRVPLPKSKGRGSTRPLLKASPYQPVERDFAFAVAGDVPAEKILRAARGADKALIQAVTLFDAFEGGNLGQGRKSIAFSVTLQAPDRTLTEDDIAAALQKIVAAVTKATGGTLRS